MKSDSLKRKLASYASLAGGILAAGVTNAQVVYTDVNPDVVINLGDSYSLDLNNDGTVDYMIMGVKGGTWQKIEIDNPSFDNKNEIAAYVSPYTYVYASLFSAGSLIDNTREFHYGYGNGYTSEPYPFATLFISYTSGIGYGQWQGAIDSYCGLRFNLNSQKHYAWVRMDVSQDASSATIKDYAFDATPDKGIEAGAGIVGISPIVNDESFKIIAANEILQIKTTGLNFPARAIISNEVGQVVKEFLITSAAQQESISELKSQLYIVSVSDGTKTYSVKIVL